MVEEQRLRLGWKGTALVFAAWTVFGLLAAYQLLVQLELRGVTVPRHFPVLHNLYESYLWALATLVIFWLVRRAPLERGRLLLSAAIHLVGALALSLARVIAITEVSTMVRWIPERPFHEQFWARFHQYLLFYTLLLGIAHAILYYRRYRERERAAERLAAGLTEARLQALKMQLQPHFLFNTLNAISALIPAEARPARRMVARLGDLLRISLEHEDTQEVTLREELEFLQPYIEIEQARLEERLAVDVDIAPATLDARVPHLILQPLVENAIRHGIAPRIEPGRVRISSVIGEGDGLLHLEVRDDGPGLGNGTESRTRKGVGLANVQSRLEQLYGGGHRFELGNHPDGGTFVKVSLPLRPVTGTEGAKESPPR